MLYSKRFICLIKYCTILIKVFYRWDHRNLKIRHFLQTMQMLNCTVQIRNQAYRPIVFIFWIPTVSRCFKQGFLCTFLRSGDKDLHINERNIDWVWIFSFVFLKFVVNIVCQKALNFSSFPIFLRLSRYCLSLFLIPPRNRAWPKPCVECICWY